MIEPHVEPAGPARSKKIFVLCFDGTGMHTLWSLELTDILQENKFSGDETDSNILKTYRMLDRGDGSTFTFYQPGMGTYVSSNNLQTTGLISRIKSWYIKSKDAAIGSSFAEHVMGGYRFLMRYYSTEGDLYFFGFIRGAHTAQFLAEMLDHVGLLSAGNEELTRFAWKTYAKWAGRRIGNSEKDKQKERDLYDFMRGFRERFSRRIRRIRFLGLFDTVNSVPAFENVWMQRSKFPYTAKSSAEVIRHAVSIEERRVKFLQDLICRSKKDEDKDEPKSGMHRYQSDLPTLAKHQNLDQYAGTTTALTIGPDESVQDNHPLPIAVPSIKIEGVAGSDREKLVPPQHAANQSLEHFEDALEHSDKLEVVRSRSSMSFVGDYVTRSIEDLSAQHPQTAAYAKKHPS